MALSAVECVGCRASRIYAVSVGQTEAAQATATAASVDGWIVYRNRDWHCPRCVAACADTMAHRDAVRARARILGEWRQVAR